jgi:iron complex outermembrane recepter protein
LSADRFRGKSWPGDERRPYTPFGVGERYWEDGVRLHNPGLFEVPRKSRLDCGEPGRLTGDTTMRPRDTAAAPIRTLRSALAAGLCVAVMWPAGLRAQPAKLVEDEPVRLEKITVRGESVPGWLEIGSARSGWSVPSNLASAVATIPGLAMHHMGAAAAEPLLRGLGSDRLVTTLDGLPLPNASPTRTASPFALLAGGLTAGVELSKALPSVTLGPPANAGYLRLSQADGADADRTDRTYVGTDWNFDRAGGDVLAVEIASQGPWMVRAAAAMHSLGDYTAGDGTVVPARDRNAGATLHLDWRPDPQHRLQFGALFSRQEVAVNSALPLDTRNTNTTAFTGGYGWAASDLTWIEARLGVGVTRPHLDNFGRPAPARITADGRTLSVAGGASVRHQTAAGDEITAGFDATQEERRLERKRPGAVDLLWPDLRQSDVGGFAEITRVLTADWKLRLGARIDAADSEARAADGLAFNRSIRNLYAAYNGPAAVQTKRSEIAGAANALLTGRLSPALTTSLGAGFSRQPPGASERYRAFSDALGGGYEIGNPTAEAEAKYELAWSLRWQQRTLAVNLDLFGSFLPNYLHRTRVGITTPPPPPPPEAVVYGYRATEATFMGGELEALWQPLPDTWGRLTAAGVTGNDRNAHRRLPEIPPAAFTLAAGRTWSAVSLKPWVECGLRSTLSRRNPAPDDMPVFADASAFTLADVRCGLTWRNLRASLAVENVFDRLYDEYLSPPAAAVPPSGSLRPGARIPGPGRTFTLTVSYGGR